MFGAIDGGLLLEVAKMEGYMVQLELDLECPPWIFVDPEYLTSIPMGFNVVQSNGKEYSSTSSKDHPYFETTRNWLENKGYIKCEHSHWNGDQVIKPFYFNNVYLDVGEKFSSAPAMEFRFGKPELYNDGKPMDVSNYKDEDEW